MARLSEDELCAAVEWDQERYGIGIKIIDEQHKVLLDLVSQLTRIYSFLRSKANSQQQYQQQQSQHAHGSGSGTPGGADGTPTSFKVRKQSHQAAALGAAAPPTRRQGEPAFGRGSQVSTVVDELVSYSAKYLTAEDHILESYGYAERAGHFEEHEAFVRELCRIHRLIDEGDAELEDVRRLLTFLRIWLDEHIPKSDRRYAALLLEKGVGS